MTEINTLIRIFVGLVEAGGIVRIIKLIFDIMAEPDSMDANLRRIRHVIFFMVCAVLASSLKTAVSGYF